MIFLLLSLRNILKDIFVLLNKLYRKNLDREFSFLYIIDLDRYFLLLRKLLNQGLLIAYFLRAHFLLSYFHLLVLIYHLLVVLLKEDLRYYYCYYYYFFLLLMLNCSRFLIYCLVELFGAYFLFLGFYNILQFP